jgi:uncharacterized protein (DUF342 family)
MTTYPGLVLVESDGSLVATVDPAPDRPVLDIVGLRSLLKASGETDGSVSEEVLAQLVERYNAATDPFELPLRTGGKARFTLEVSADAMHVWLSTAPAAGAAALLPDEIFQALGEARVSFGVDRDAVAAACAAPSVDRALVASGVPAVNGENATFELLVADTRDRTPHLNAEGLIDFRDLGEIPTVAADAPLMRRTPATSGSDGRSVRDEVVAATHGKELGFSDRLLGAYVDSADRNLLRATFSGQPIRCGNGVNVEHILRLRDVNMTSGNISFDGTVKIEGEVLPGMKVHATGDIVVGGVVDGAELDAGGNVKVGGGIIAKAKVRAAGSVTARFVENAQVSAGTTISIDDAALQSDLQANNQIVVGAKSNQRGRLAGGSARAMMLIRTPILGAATAGVTRLQLGVNPVLEEQYQALLHRIEKLREEEENLGKVVKHLGRQGDRGGLLERATASWQQTIKTWGALMPEREELERQLAMTSGAKVEVGVGVEGAVDMTFGHKVGRLRQTYPAGSLTLAGDRVVFTEPRGSSKPAV